MPFQKGKSGNPKKIFKKGNKAAVGHGRPPRLPDMEEAVARAIGEVVTSGKYKGLTDWDMVMMRMKKMAKAGNTKAAQFLADRGYGKAPQSIDITTKGDKFESVHPEIKVYNTAPPLAESEIAVITPDKTVKQLKK